MPISALGAALFWTPVAPELWWVLIGIGALFFVVQLALIYAVKYANVQTVSTLYLSNILFAALVGIVIWQTQITLLAGTGMLLTIIGAVLTIRAQGTHRRVKRIYLTAKSQDIIAKINAIGDSIRPAILGRMSATDVKKFMQHLANMKINLESFLQHGDYSD